MWDRVVGIVVVLIIFSLMFMVGCGDVGVSPTTPPSLEEVNHAIMVPNPFPTHEGEWSCRVGRVCVYQANQSGGQ